ncbi:GDSL-type esterase/lipase family protein [Streptomyces sp. NPDC051561]|uniref:GDSL-type esterase/lipase family protein n=1 Tax=Streptomyces sp. NPDC051561 TaxID=3365658 RepID=UPI0037962A30
MNTPHRDPSDNARDLISTPLTAGLLRGALDLERTEQGLLPHRLPAWARKQIPDGQLAMAEAQPSGVRLAFRTRATVVELDTLRTKMAYVGAPDRPDGTYDLLVDGTLAGQSAVTGGHTLRVDMTTGSAENIPGPVGTVRFDRLPGHDKQIEIWLPFNETTQLVALRTDAPVEPVPVHGRPVWLHHGSSVSHGSDAASPTTTWPALAASLGGVELINLGFGGSALLDPFTARAMRDTPADLISVKLGINLVNTDLMRLRALGPAVHGFLDTLREGHRTTPLLVVSSVLCPIHEETPGPSMPDFSDLSAGRLQFKATGDPGDPTRLTLTRIRAELAKIVAQRAADDPHLHYLDGRELYGEKDFAELPLPDQIHPDAATHRRIGERFAALAFCAEGPLTTGPHTTGPHSTGPHSTGPLTTGPLTTDPGRRADGEA